VCCDYLRPLLPSIMAKLLSLHREIYNGYIA
jgi:hypothetical protein